jgi:hypothetical protein
MPEQNYTYAEAFLDYKLISIGVLAFLYDVFCIIVDYSAILFGLPSVIL